MELLPVKISVYRPVPLMGYSVHAGFPSPADDHLNNQLDIAEFMVTRPAATFFATVDGDCMVDAGIMPGDKLVVDRSLKPQLGCIIVAVLDGEFLVRRLKRLRPSPLLMADNAKYPEIEVQEGQTFEVWGVVSGCFRKML